MTEPKALCETLPEDWFTTSAPERQVFQVDLPCTPERLFEIFDDEASWPQWATPGINKVEWTSPRPYGVGTTRTVTLTGGLEVYEEFTHWEPGRELSFFFLGSSEPIWKRFGEHYLVEATDQGCRLQWTVAYEPMGTFGWFHPWCRPVMRLALGSYMKKLTKYVEKNP